MPSFSACGRSVFDNREGTPPFISGRSTTSGYSSVTNENGEDYGYDRAGALTKSPRGDYSYNSQAQTDRIDPKGEQPFPLTYTGLGQDQRLSAGPDLFTDNQLGLSLRLQPSDRFTYLTRFIPVGLQSPAGDPFTAASVRGQPLGQRLLGGENFYYLTDDQGSVLAVTDADRKLVREYEYEPYGASRDQSGQGPASVARFTGEFLDPSSGLYKIGARYYDPEIGRWTQRDPILQPFDPVNSNPYVYAGADPVNLGDPSGRSVPGDVYRFLTEDTPQYFSDGVEAADKALEVTERLFYVFDCTSYLDGQREPYIIDGIIVRGPFTIDSCDPLTPFFGEPDPAY